VPGCVSTTGTASPDPCVKARRRNGDDVEITVLTSTASVWHLAVPTLDAFACAKAKTSRGTPKLAKVLGVAATDVLHDLRPGRVDVKKPLAVCDPADETGEGRAQPARHLVAYAVKQGKVCASDGAACRREADCGTADACAKQTAPARTTAVVHDQLGTLAVETRKLTTLLVPSAQGLGVEPPEQELGTAGVDPFMCYALKTLKRVCAGDPAVACRTDAACGDAGPCQGRFPKGLTVRLDEEGGAGPQVFAVKKPTLLCAPADLLPAEAATPAAYLQCLPAEGAQGAMRERRVGQRSGLQEGRGLRRGSRRDPLRSAAEAAAGSRPSPEQHGPRGHPARYQERPQRVPAGAGGVPMSKVHLSLLPPGLMVRRAIAEHSSDGCGATRARRSLFQQRIAFAVLVLWSVAVWSTLIGSSAQAEPLLSESFEDGVLDPLISVDTVGGFVSGPGIKATDQLSGSSAFGFGLSNCAASCFDNHVTNLRVTFPEPTFVSCVGFKEIELFDNWGSRGGVYVDGDPLANSNFGREPYNDRTADVLYRNVTLAVGSEVTELRVRVRDITNRSEIYIDDLEVLGMGATSCPDPPSPCSVDAHCVDENTCTADGCGLEGLCVHDRTNEGGICEAGAGICLDGTCVPVPVEPQADLSILSPCRPEPVCPGGTVRCDIHVFNQGPTSAPVVRVALDLTEDLGVVSALTPLHVYGPGGSTLGSGETPVGEGQHVEWTATEVPAGGKVATWLTLAVGGSGGEKTVTAYAQTVDGAPIDPNPANESDLLNIVPNGALCPPADYTQLAGSSPRAGSAICPAESLFYLATFQHPGPGTADVVIDLDPCLDPGTVGALMPETGCEIATEAITCTDVPLDGGGGGQVSFGVKPRLACVLGAMIEVQGTVTFDDALMLETNTTSHELVSCATPTVTATPTPTFTPGAAPTPAPTESVCGTVGPGEPVTTDLESDGATTDDPVETHVKVPVGGEVCITEQAATGLAPVGYAVVGQEIDITAPAATAGNPLMITFVFDGAWVPPGKGPFTIEVFRNGALVPGCVTSSGTANPDPCVMDRRRAVDDVAITVLTSEASLWQLAVPTLDAFACAKAKKPTGAPKFEKVPGLAATDVLQGFAPRQVDVRKPVAVCDPADETAEGRARPETHLVAYAVKQGKVCAAAGTACRRAADCGAEDTCTKQSPPARTTTVVHDQLGTLAVETRKLTTLLVPTAQSLDEQPPSLELGTAGVDPFTCYAVKTLKRVCAGDPALACRDDAACGDSGPCQTRFPKGLTVRLDDEAGPGPQVFAVKKPTLLCTPANLLPAEAATPAAYLQCYQLKALKGQCANAASVNGAGCKKEEDCGGVPGATHCEAQPKPQPVHGRHLNNAVLGSIQLDTKTDRSVCLPAQVTWP